MRRGEIWFATVPGGGDRPVLVLTRDPVADRIDHVVVAALTRTRRNLVSELPLDGADGMPIESVVSFDNLRTLRREAFRRRVTTLSDARMAGAARRAGLQLRRAPLRPESGGPALASRTA